MAVGFREAVLVWLRIGLLSFGGPAGQIALMHRMLVEERGWIDEKRFLHALNFCMLLPGPEAQQLATYIGWMLHGIRGGLVAGLLFILPGFAAIMGLSLVYALYADLPQIEGVFLGLKAAVLALVLQAMLRLSAKALRNWRDRALALAAFAALFLANLPFPLVIAGAALIGLIRARAQPAPDIPRSEAEGWGRAARVLAAGLALWFAPVALVIAWGGMAGDFAQIGIFFSKMAVVTFGGAYAVLAYVAQQAVETHHWLLPGEMVDGLGLAETTPGPLVMVVQFVGFLAGFRSDTALPPILGGIIGASLTVWVTFVPCFLWIFLLGPHVERLRGNARLAGALSAITAAVTGVIANLALWFALHSLFAQMQSVWGVSLPVATSLRIDALLLAVVALLAVFALRLGLLWVLAISAGLGLALQLLPS